MLDVSLTAMITTIVVFLALIYFLNIKLYRPLLLHMEKREAIIKEDETNAMKNAQDADADKAEIVRIMDAAKLQAVKIKQEAMDSAKQAAAREIAEKKTAMEEDFDQFLGGLDEQKRNLRNDLQAKIPEFKKALSTAVAKV